MEQIKNLITALQKCIPDMDATPLYASLPVDKESDSVLEWLYEHLEAQNLMVYEEWKEYCGDIPTLKPLANLSLPEKPAEYIFTLIEKIDWSTASIDPFLLPYVMPWLEHINFYLKPQGIRLVDLMPAGNAYIICVRDDEDSLDELHSCLEAFDLGINERSMLDKQEVAVAIESSISE
ncbi:hypothetical protein BSU01_06465 [Erwinia billingiae]|uniref:hypothetical protein n=1 Tax=Erwinia billingiae TaxID=182337 RepID=UPI0019D1516A|nr:hypothetical protein [Erwinia billingiae]MBN7121353.1 hypothetical protein [Erwinia billingiae]